MGASLMRGVMRTSTRCALGLGLLGLGGCAPVPHFETVAPEISGQISVCREPMVGLAVSYTHQKVLGDPDCSVIDATATTGEDGRFTLERARDFRFWVSMGDPGYYYEICAKQVDQWVLLWSKKDFGFVETPAEISCDLEAPLDEEDSRGGRGRCSIRHPRWDSSPIQPRITTGCSGR